MINDGGNLTSKRKDIFLSTIYKIEDACDANSLNIKLYNQYKKQKRINIFYYLLLVGYGIFSYFALFSIFSTTDIIQKILTFIITIVIFAFIFFILKMNIKKIKSLQKEIKENFKIFYSDLNTTPNFSFDVLKK